MILAFHQILDLYSLKVTGINIRLCSHGVSQLSWGHQQHLRSLPLHQLQEVFFCHAKVSVDHHRYFITLIVLIWCIRFVTFCVAYAADVWQIGWALLVLGSVKITGVLGLFLLFSNPTYPMVPLPTGNLRHIRYSVITTWAVSEWWQNVHSVRWKGNKSLCCLAWDQLLVPQQESASLLCPADTDSKESIWLQTVREKSQGRTAAIQCVHLQQRLIRRDMLMACSAQGESLLLAVKCSADWHHQVDLLFLVLAFLCLSHPCHQNSLRFINHTEKSSFPWSWPQGHQKQ